VKLTVDLESLAHRAQFDVKYLNHPQLRGKVGLYPPTDFDESYYVLSADEATSLAYGLLAAVEQARKAS
jgi:hypothetical protein